jgi:hypothetical protein
MSRIRFNTVLAAAWPLAKTFLWAGSLLAKHTLKAVAALALVFVAIWIVAVVPYTGAGYYEWYFPVWNARVTVSGKPSHGFLHRERLGGSSIITRTDLPNRVSYRVFFGTGPQPKPRVSACGKWSTYRFAVVFRGDVNPPCCIIAAPESSDTEQEPEAVAVGPKSLEIVGHDGKRVRADW